MEAANRHRARTRPHVTPGVEPADSLPWRCQRCGTEGVTLKALTAQQTLERMVSQHDRLAPGCTPRLIVVARDGYLMVIDYEFSGNAPGS